MTEDISQHMTNEHPLTDEMIKTIEDRIHECFLFGVDVDIAQVIRPVYDKGYNDGYEQCCSNARMIWGIR
jgi:hypothetical protein